MRLIVGIFSRERNRNLGLGRHPTHPANPQSSSPFAGAPCEGEHFSHTRQTAFFLKGGKPRMQGA
jgi:hypothetical protein